MLYLSNHLYIMETVTTLKQDKTALTIIKDIRILENPSSKVEKDNFFDYPNKVSDSFVICCLQNGYWLYFLYSSNTFQRMRGKNRTVWLILKFNINLGVPGLIRSLSIACCPDESLLIQS